VAYLGPEGTFSHMAGLEFFGHALSFMPMPHLEDVFQAVENQGVDLGLVPLENSLNGAVGRSIDLFASHELFIQAEWFSRISHSLMSREAALGAVKVVYSHSQALGQCSEWLRRNLPDARQVSLESTAAAAHRALDEEGSAAIGHGALAPRLGLSLLAEGIEDVSDNWTRFCVIGAGASARRDLSAGPANKSSVLFSLADRPGSLAGVLRCLGEAGINMSKLESRPLRTERWKYLFFADLDCDLTGAAHSGLVENLRAICHSFRILGAYPAGRQQP
jgi:chorismate mutase/prephenate dehydratase